MRQDGIMRAALPGSPRCVAPRDRHHMTMLCPTLSDQQIVATVDPVEVGAFRRSPPGACPDAPGLGQESAGSDIDLALLDPPEGGGQVNLIRQWEAECLG